MAWPSLLDYQQAVLNPSMCFKHPQLRNAKPRLNKLGLAMPISGGNASVYQFASNAQTLAVKCFSNKLPNQEKRYGAISDELKILKLPFMVDFEFLNEGIRIENNHYPILKMDWIDGDTLDVHIEKNKKSEASLWSLVKNFRELSQKIRSSGIAHGDLQHGNILVSTHGIKLIDYDGLFVPAIAGLGSCELGLRNYQHPLRNSMDYFGPFVDDFSLWLIYISVLCIADRPQIWDKLKKEQALILSEQDLKDPLNSEAFYVMSEARDPEIKSLINFLVQICLNSSLKKIPRFDPDVILRKKAVAVHENGRSSMPEEINSTSLSSQWLHDHLYTSVVEPDISRDLFDIKCAKSEWMVDWIESHQEPGIDSNEPGVDYIECLNCGKTFQSWDGLPRRLCNGCGGQFVDMKNRQSQPKPLVVKAAPSASHKKNRRMITASRFKVSSSAQKPKQKIMDLMRDSLHEDNFARHKADGISVESLLANRPESPDEACISYNKALLLINSRSGVPFIKNAALELFRVAADGGLSEAQYLMGCLYAAGKTLARDYSKAIHYYRPSSDQGNPQARCNLGFMFFYGLGVTKSLQEALKYYTLAADQKHALAQYNLANMYFLGAGVKRDTLKGLFLYRMSADDGCLEARNLLGLIYFSGRGVPSNYAEALRHFRRAADGGHMWAQYNLGVLYSSLPGLYQNRSLALFYYRKAADQGHEHARMAVRVLERHPD